MIFVAFLDVHVAILPMYLPVFTFCFTKKPHVLTYFVRSHLTSYFPLSFFHLLYFTHFPSLKSPSFLFPSMYHLQPVISLSISPQPQFPGNIPILCSWFLELFKPGDLELGISNEEENKTFVFLDYITQTLVFSSYIYSIARIMTSVFFTNE